jgi:hypothetical protein
MSFPDLSCLSFHLLYALSKTSIVQKIFADLNDSLSKHLSKDQISAKDHKRREEECKI